jgi:hypothetical protein
VGEIEAAADARKYEALLPATPCSFVQFASLSANRFPPSANTDGSEAQCMCHVHLGAWMSWAG